MKVITEFVKRAHGPKERAHGPGRTAVLQPREGGSLYVLFGGSDSGTIEHT